MNAFNPTLHEALAAHGIRSEPGTIPERPGRVLFREHAELGRATAQVGWALVHLLNEEPATDEAWVVREAEVLLSKYRGAV